MGFSKVVQGHQDSRVEVDVISPMGSSNQGVWVESFANDGKDQGISIFTPKQARRLAKKLRRAARYIEESK